MSILILGRRKVTWKELWKHQSLKEKYGLASSKGLPSSHRSISAPASPKRPCLAPQKAVRFADEEKSPVRNKEAELAELREWRGKFVEMARAESTWKQYSYAFKRFEKWAAPLKLATMPCSKETAELYIAFVAHSSESVAALVSAFASINAFHVRKGFESLVQEKSTKLLMEGIKRAFGRPAKQSEFLSPDQMGKFVEICLAEVPERKSLRFLRSGWCEAACFRGAARFGDLVRINKKM